MNICRFSLVYSLLIIRVGGAPADWNGVYQDTVFGEDLIHFVSYRFLPRPGGELRVCTSFLSVSGKYYGQVYTGASMVLLISFNILCNVGKVQ